jgi:hypothetical protein
VSGIAWDKERLTGIGGALGVVESFQPDAAFERCGVMAIQAARFKDRPDVAREIDGSVERSGAEQGENPGDKDLPAGTHGEWDKENLGRRRHYTIFPKRLRENGRGGDDLGFKLFQDYGKYGF